jgi:hypothetical protein
LSKHHSAKNKGVKSENRRSIAGDVFVCRVDLFIKSLESFLAESLVVR